MRLLAIIVLTSLVMLAAFPQMSAAGPAMHECAACPEAIIDANQQAPAHRHQVDAPCSDMATCAGWALVDTSQPLNSANPPRLRHAWPEPRSGTTISLSLDLPPPRA